MELYNAVENNNTEEVKRLLKRDDIDVNWQYNGWYNATAFHCACVNGNIQIVKLLIEDKRVCVNQTTSTNATPLNVACAYCHIDTVKLLMDDERVNVNQVDLGGRTPFLIACAFGHSHIVKLMMNYGKLDVNIHEQGKIPLHFSINHLDVLGCW